MKPYAWGIIPGLCVLLIAAAWIDRPALQPGEKFILNQGSAAEYENKDELRSCETAEESYQGPLVPDQNNSGENPSNKFTEDEGIPIKEWSQRAGFGVAWATDPQHWAAMLGSGWYIDWGIRTEPQLNGLEHWQMIRVHEDCITPAVDAILSTLARMPGQVWIIGNEPDVIWQDNVTAEHYAVAYHDLYQMIKSADPAAQVAVGGIAQATPLRLQYLDQVLQAYQELYHGPLPADWWTVHGYVLREEKGSWGTEIPPGIDAIQGELREVSDHGRIDLFENQILAFRQWMAEQGYQNTPLALTEFGIIMPTSYGFPPEMIASYLEETFTWLYEAEDTTIGYPADQFRLVQRWAWYSIADPTYSSSNLGDIASGRLTLVGEQYRTIVSAMRP